MAIQNTSFYQYLEAAFRYRLFNSKGATATPDTPFSYLGYNLPFKRIFYYARKILPKFYTSEFPDTEEGNLQMAKKVLEKLDKHQDLELERYFDPATAPTGYEQLIAEAQAASQQATAEQQTSTQAPAPAGGFPTAPSISSAPRIVRNIPPASSETPTGEHSIKSPSRFSGFKSSVKNFGSRAGVFFQRNVGKYLTVGRIATVVSGGIGAITGGALTNGSAVGILGGGGLGALAPSWIRSGGATKFLGKVGNGTINAGVGISNQVSMGATRLSVGSASKKLALGLIGVLFFLVVGTGLIGGLPGTTPDEATPTPSSSPGSVQDFNISIDDGFAPEVYKWADEVLASTATVAEKFKTLLGTSAIVVKSTCDISITRGRVISLRNRKEFCPGSDKDGPTARESLFKQVFVHELGHIINGSYRPGKYGDQIKNVIAAEGYLTAYSENAATADDEICGYGDLDTRADEDFAESISYFVNQGIEEQNYGCGIRLNQNPIYAQAGNQTLYPKHYQLMIDLLR